MHAEILFDIEALTCGECPCVVRTHAPSACCGYLMSNAHHSCINGIFLHSRRRRPAMPDPELPRLAAWVASVLVLCTCHQHHVARAGAASPPPASTVVTLGAGPCTNVAPAPPSRLRAAPLDSRVGGHARALHTVDGVFDSRVRLLLLLLLHSNSECTAMCPLGKYWVWQSGSPNMYVEHHFHIGASRLRLFCLTWHQCHYVWCPPAGRSVVGRT